MSFFIVNLVDTINQPLFKKGISISILSLTFYFLVDKINTGVVSKTILFTRESSNIEILAPVSTINIISVALSCAVTSISSGYDGSNTVCSINFSHHWEQRLVIENWLTFQGYFASLAMCTTLYTFLHCRHKNTSSE